MTVNASWEDRHKTPSWEDRKKLVPVVQARVALLNELAEKLGIGTVQTWFFTDDRTHVVYEFSDQRSRIRLPALYVTEEGTVAMVSEETRAKPFLGREALR